MKPFRHTFPAVRRAARVIITVSARFAPYDQVQSLAVQLLESRGPKAVDKVLSRNVVRFYQLDRS